MIVFYCEQVMLSKKHDGRQYSECYWTIYIPKYHEKNYPGMCVQELGEIRKYDPMTGRGSNRIQI
jgi:hypothetical protein